MTRIRIIFSLLCVLCGTMSSYAFFEDCGSQLGKINEISISSCTASDEKCLFTRGTDVYVSLKFTPKKDISKMKADVCGIVFGITAACPVKNFDICKDPYSALKCPLRKNEVAEYNTTCYVPKMLPPMSLHVKWELKGDNNKKIICVKCPIKIV